MPHRPSVILFFATLLSCASIPTVEPYAPSAGIRTCRRLANAAAARSWEEFFGGAVVGVIGAAGIGTGIAMGPDNRPDAAWYDRTRHLLVIAPSAVVSALGVHLISRSHRTDALSEQAAAAVTDAKTDADQYLYYECVAARADWSGDSREMIRVQIQLLKENLAAAMAAQQAVAAVENQAHGATSVAVEAKTTANRAAQIASASAEATQNLVGVTEGLMETDSRKKDGGVLLRDAATALTAARANLASKPDAGASSNTPAKPLEQY